MPGAGDPYFYEWYVGIENVIKMLNPDSGIRCVIFQHDEYDTIDDVVVEYTNDTVQMCYQIKHNVETAVPKSLTFGSMKQPEWNMLLDRLYPLVIRINDDGEYALFHNDFRVFLMGIIHPYQIRYEEIALSLAQYFLQNNEGILSYILGIPLLQCAKQNKLIPQYFTNEFVINALFCMVSIAI